MSRLESVIMGCIYCALGIPLVVLSAQTPEVENITTLNNNPNSTQDLLNYPSNAVVAMNILPLQRWVCAMGNHQATCIKKCDQAFKSPMPSPFSKITGKPVEHACEDLCKGRYPASLTSQEQSRCKALGPLDPNAKHAWGVKNLAKEFNGLRMASLVIGILILILAFFKFIEAIAPVRKSKNKKK